ncbi:hypothetical protein TNIN_240311 [Trichonephila inaurata madagascariensis]|uniref:Uncharacterized protein n=1 Tax=Trichonephila inaurata madagascariensis TaxID=2747483 RepID=A0A8X6IAQ4_9ARAC|nr:hypothetical protein TNIN_240311 [Trichonephila inaurata madagascariensis]
MDLTFDNLLDMEPRTPTRPSTPTPTMICSRLQQLAKEVGGKRKTVHHRCAESLWNLRDPDNPYVKELLNNLYEFTDLHHQAVSEFSSLSPCIINGCHHHDFSASTPIITISDTKDNSNDNFNMKTEKSLPTKRKEKSDDFTTPPSSKICKFKDIQPNFQIEFANRFNVLSQEAAENLTTDLASTAIQNTVNAPLPNENTLNAPTLTKTL